MEEQKTIKKEDLHDAVICKENDSVLEVSKIMRDTQTRHIIVVDEELKPVGLISTGDINNRVVAEEKKPEQVSAETIMTKPIDTIEITASYDDAYAKMIERGTYTIPVTSQGKLTGILDFNLLFSKLCNACEVEDEANKSSK